MIIKGKNLSIQNLFSNSRCDSVTVMSIVEISWKIIVHVLSLHVQVSVFHFSILIGLSLNIGKCPFIPVHLVVVFNDGLASPSRLEDLFIKGISDKLGG